MSDNDTLTLPYAHLNLRYNPFGRRISEERSEVDAIRIDLDYFADRLRQPGFAIQFLREGKPGKTTHLLALRQYFPGAPYVCIDAQGPIPNIPAAPVLFIDQMQRMPRARRMEIFRRPASFAIVSHINHQREFEKAKLVFELIKLSGLTVERLHKNIEERIDRARRSEDQPIPTVSEEAIVALISRFGDDLRAIHAYLYNVFQNMTEVSDVKGLNADSIRQA